MKADVLVAEIGSTTTVVNAFSGIYDYKPKLIVPGQAPTSVLEGDVTIGLKAAIDQIGKEINTEHAEVFATSSAAGGLKMTVHGLVYDMTVKAAKEAALGAGANIHIITSGPLSKYDIHKIESIKPNIILIAGGVDYGEKQTALNNAFEIAKLKLNIPIIYAGNCVNVDEIKDIFTSFEQINYLHVTENVYPKIDELNVEPTRAIIQEVFEQHIIHAPGMNTVRNMIKGNIIPTPGAVMLAAKLLEKDLGDLVVFDVGGATTDIHSVTSGSEEVNKVLISPEPKAKRTVEGDLGVYINRQNLIDSIGLKKIANELSISIEELNELIASYQPIPNESQVPLVKLLTKEALSLALFRHCGNYRNLYGTGGKTKVAEGKDLTNVKYVIGTGGALTRLPGHKDIMHDVLHKQDITKLMPSKDTEVLVDNDYIMASLGVLSIKYPNQALVLLRNSLGL